MENAIFKHIRAHFKTMEGYHSAGMETGRCEDMIYLDANENPYPLPGLEGLNRYPAPQSPALLEAYAQNYGVESAHIAMTRGADEAIVILTKVFCEPHHDQILINTPTFGMYAVDAYSMPSGALNVPLLKKDAGFSLDCEGIITQAKNPDNHIKIVFLCSPNNPTGSSFPHDEIADICEALDGHAIVVLDEAYAEFSKAGSMVDDLASTPNLILLRTLSKSYALAGMRMGCMLCADKDFITLIRTKLLAAYPLPQMSIEAAFHALSPENKDIVQQNIQKILAERARMEKELKKSKHIVCIYESDANFLLIEMKNAKGFCTYAAENKIILRNFSSKEGTENCLRMAIGTPEENDKVLNLLQSYKG